MNRRWSGILAGLVLLAGLASALTPMAWQDRQVLRDSLSRVHPTMRASNARIQYYYNYCATRYDSDGAEELDCGTGRLRIA
jgi:hypothetical protein